MAMSFEALWKQTSPERRARSQQRARELLAEFPEGTVRINQFGPSGQE
jgi:hypothetical protein